LSCFAFQASPPRIASFGVREVSYPQLPHFLALLKPLHNRAASGRHLRLVLDHTRSHRRAVANAFAKGSSLPHHFHIKHRRPGHAPQDHPEWQQMFGAAGAFDAAEVQH
jgi:hypothetical protein